MIGSTINISFLNTLKSCHRDLKLGIGIVSLNPNPLSSMERYLVSPEIGNDSSRFCKTEIPMLEIMRKVESNLLLQKGASIFTRSLIYTL